MIPKILRQGLKPKHILFVVCGLSLFSSLVCSQTTTNTNSSNYPNKSIRLVSPIPPGGAPDLVARALANRLSNQLGLSVFVENKVGSNGNIAADVVSHSPADGYTLLIGMDSLFVINPYLYPKSINANNEFRQVATLASNQFVLAVNSKLPVKNLAEFVDYAKKANPIAAYASGGNGSQHHLTMERQLYYLANL